MTSHREAPSISRDPVADNTDLYAFVSPDAQDTVTFISNFIPLEEPAGGPNFHSFGDDVLYAINIDNNGDGVVDISYQFQFTTKYTIPGSFLYNVGPISSPTDPNLNVQQTYTVTQVKAAGPPAPGPGPGPGPVMPPPPPGPGMSTVLGIGIPVAPANIGPRSTPNYAAIAQLAIKALGNGITVFAGPRGEGFYVDLGSIFDLGVLRPFDSLHAYASSVTAAQEYPGTKLPPYGYAGVDGTKGFNVHSIAIQVPKTQLTSDGSNPTDPTSPKSIIGVWTSASRQKMIMEPSTDPMGNEMPGMESGPWTQVSRLGMPLVNEVLTPIGSKDYWNISNPALDSQFLANYTNPQLQNLLPVLYPGVFPNLATLLKEPVASRQRSDLVAILLTGIRAGVVTGFPGNYTGALQADYLRLNMAIAPEVTDNNTTSSTARFGILGGDFSGFPNGRRVFDNVTAVELRAIAGVTYPLVLKPPATFTPDGPAGLLTDGSTNDLVYLNTFPYLALPHQGYLHYHDPDSPNA